MITTERISRWMVNARWVLLGVACLLAAWAWKPAGQVTFDRSIENMFHAEDPLLVAYHRLKQQFGENEIVMAVYVDRDLLAPDGRGIARLIKVDEQLQQIPGVRDVLSLAELNRALNYARPIQSLVQGEDQRMTIVDPDSRLAKAYRDVFEGYTHNARGDIAALVCMLVPEQQATEPRRETIDRMREVLEKQPQGMIAGEPVMMIDGFRYLDRDGQRLGWATTSLVALVIVICFRSIRWVLIPILVVQLAILLTRASLVWLDLSLSMVSSMLTAIVTVVGVATVVHIIVRFRLMRATGMDPRTALVATGKFLAVPVFWSCTTDAFGFLSLTVARVGPVRDFGLMTAIGCGWVLCSVVLLVPGLALLGRFDTDPRRGWGDGLLGGELDWLVHSSAGRSRALILALIMLFALSVIGMLRLEIETDFTKNFRRGSPVVQSYAFIEKHLGGAGVWDVMIPAPAKLDTAFVEHVQRFQEALRSITIRDDSGRRVDGLTKVLSLIDGIEAAGVNPLMERIPAELKARGMAATMPNFVKTLRTDHTDPDRPHYLRVMLRAREQQSAAEKSQLIAEVTRISQEYFPASDRSAPAEVTGFYVLLTNLITSILRDQWTCFAVATLGVGIMMALAFRSVVLALIALIPNVFPIIVVLGTMGWLGFKMNMGAAMIAAVSMGLSVDSSIHYITSFLRARRDGRSVADSLSEVQQSVGRAVVYSTVALTVGFLALCNSEFVPTIYFGCLVSLAMLGGLLGNLVVLPLLLRAVSRDDLHEASGRVRLE
ncbi:MAG: efflux RND transporter permease subunit [Pirellulaceae bacterium]